MAEYVRVVQGLLRGDVMTWDAAAIQMLHSPGMASGRPIEVEWLIGADGPKGIAAAKELGEGIFSTSARPGFDWSLTPVLGTGLRDDEAADS